MTALFLDANQLSGTIPNSLSKLSNLTVLDLSSNNLSGGIPSNLVLISVLTYFNVSRNGLAGEVPVDNPTASDENRDLCGEPLDRKCEDATEKNRSKRLIVLIVVVVCAACLRSLCCFYIFSLLRWRKKLKMKISNKY
ncbi:hypothetical protein V6N13_086115 [Hibiscus sabdariffa]|uniref:Uncharacterized protein n=1 Tax=Hibiscus sabdariffa TaxID=183260 RepID=A0ABR2FS78_9ROSI